MSASPSSFSSPWEYRSVRGSGSPRWKVRGAWDGEQSSDRTIALYERALGRDPANHFLLFDLARAYAARGQRDLAGQLLRRVLDLYPQCSTVQFMAAQLYRRIDRPILAIKCYRRVLELEPQHARSTEILVEMSTLAGRYGSER